MFKEIKACQPCFIFCLVRTTIFFLMEHTRVLLILFFRVTFVGNKGDTAKNIIRIIYETKVLYEADQDLTRAIRSHSPMIK